VLEDLVTFFGCGKVRNKGASSTVLVYAVDRMKDLQSAIVPFLRATPATNEAC
jgi:hypothetical protein